MKRSAAPTVKTPDLNEVVSFFHVVEQGSFTRAAVTLGLPKSTVSRQVARLEAEVGVQLLTRTTRRLSLTDAGMIYFDQIGRGLAEISAATRTLTETRNTPSGTVRFTCPVDLGRKIHPILAGYLAAYPEVSLRVDLTDRYVDLVAENYDIAVRAGELNDASLRGRRLGDSGWRLVASPSYLKRRGTPRTIADLGHHDCILFSPRSTAATWRFEGRKRAKTVRVRGRVATNDLDGVKEAAVSGLGIAQLPLLFFQSEMERRTLVSLLPKESLSSGALWIVYPATRYPRPAVRAFVDHFVREWSSLFRALG